MLNLKYEKSNVSSLNERLILEIKQNDDENKEDINNFFFWIKYI